VVPREKGEDTLEETNALAKSSSLESCLDIPFCRDMGTWLVLFIILRTLLIGNCELLLGGNCMLLLTGNWELVAPLLGRCMKGPVNMGLGRYMLLWST